MAALNPDPRSRFPAALRQLREFRESRRPVSGSSGNSGKAAFTAMADQLTNAPLSSPFAPSFLLRRGPGQAVTELKRRNTWLQRKTAR
jgi:hypothetical protein